MLPIVLSSFLLILFAQEAHCEVLVTLKFSTENSSSLHHDQYELCLSDYKDTPVSCSKSKLPYRTLPAPEWINGTIFTLSKAELMRAQSKGNYIVGSQRVRLPWRSDRDADGQQFLVLTDSEENERHAIDLSSLTLKNPTLNVTVFGLSIWVHIQCAHRYFGPLCVVGCNLNPRFDCHPETGELTCNQNWVGFHCDKKFCLNGGEYVNRTKCECTSGWTGIRCNETAIEDDGSQSKPGSFDSTSITYTIVGLCILAVAILAIAAAIMAYCIRRSRAAPSEQNAPLVVAVNSSDKPM